MTSLSLNCNAWKARPKALFLSLEKSVVNKIRSNMLYPPFGHCSPPEHFGHNLLKTKRTFHLDNVKRAHPDRVKGPAPWVNGS